jgi:hypothetical protein
MPARRAPSTLLASELFALKPTVAVRTERLHQGGLADAVVRVSVDRAPDRPSAPTLCLASGGWIPPPPSVSYPLDRSIGTKPPSAPQPTSSATAIQHPPGRVALSCPRDGCAVDVVIPGGRRLVVEHRLTFGDVGVGAPMILRDDDGRPALAINHGSFATSYGGKVGDDVVVDPAGEESSIGSRARQLRLARRLQGRAHRAGMNLRARASRTDIESSS